MAYRYIGSKVRVAGRIVEAVRSIAGPGASVADPMCGTASVSAALASEGYSVFAADELTFPILHATVRLLLGSTPAFADSPSGSYDGTLAELNALQPEPGFFFREYSPAERPRNGCKPRRYFTPENAAKIDAIRRQVRCWQEGRRTTEIETQLLLHDLILAVNDVANIAGTYGYYRAEWNRSALVPLLLLPSVFKATRGPHRVTQRRVEELASEIEVDVLYLDPPYTKRQYAGNYHILETLARQDEPEPVGEGGLRDWYGQYSAFCSKRTVRDSLERVVATARARHILISYSEDGLIPPRELTRLLSRYGKLRCLNFRTPRYRSNGGKSAPVVEQLYHLALA